MKKIIYFTILATTQIVWSQKSDISQFYKNSWGLRNTGETIVFDHSPLQTYRLQARKGEDIHLATPVKGKKVKVAVIDTGVDTTHPLLKNKIFRNESECVALEKYKKCVSENGAAGCVDMLVSGQNGFDQDKNQYPGDCSGWSILGETTKQNIIGTPVFEDTIGHGTHVAGIVASVSDNIQIVPIQVIGDAPNQPVKPFSFDPNPKEDIRGGFTPDANLADRIARGIIYAINAKVDVINLSIGWPQAQDADIMRQAIAEAQRRGIIVIAAAGNDSTTALLRPCQYEGVICVAAHRPDGSIAHFSNYGYGVDIAAPGTSILSTIPENTRSIRLPGYTGIDILSGTSQASPYVAGVAAEMLSRGIPASEIYARLMLGARKIKPELGVYVGPITSQSKPIKSIEFNSKFVLSGLMDMQNSLNIKAQPLILKADKETHVIKWDKKSTDLNFSFNIKNYWSDVSNVSIVLKNKYATKIMPEIKRVHLTNSEIKNQNVSTVDVELKITDSTDASQSQIPSDLEFIAEVSINGQKHTEFDVKAEIQIQLDPNDRDLNFNTIKISGQLERGMKKFLVDEIYDNKPNDRDYIALAREEDYFLVSLMKWANGSYQLTPSQKIKFNGNIKNTRPYSRTRLDIDSDGKSEYVLGIQEFKEVGDGGLNTNDYTLHFFIFNSDMKLLKTHAFYDDRALISLDYTWMKIGNKLRPAWMGLGKNVVKKYDITDLWQTNPDEKPDSGLSDLRFYYLDDNFKLNVVENTSGYKIVDAIQAQRKNVASGTIPVLLAKNLGTELKPSYLNAFAIGWISQGKLMTSIKPLSMNSTLNYRNLIDTKKDKSLNLSKTDDEFVGTFWFGVDAHQKQRISTIDFTNSKVTDKILSSNRSLFDSPLRIRAAFSGKKEKGVFLVTNTEIEYHNLTANKTARSSLNKYTFFGDDLMTDLQFPITLTSKDGLTKKPALFTTEGSGLNKGVRFLVPTDIGSDDNLKMVSPARLRMTSPKGCISIDSPVYIDGSYYLDYDCKDTLIRVKLVY